MGSTFLLAAACFAAFTGIHALTRLPFVESADRVFSHSVFHVGGDFVTAVMKRISSAGGDSMTLYGLPLLAVGLLFLRRGSALRFFAGVILGTAGVSAMAKGLLPRLRPDLVHHRNWDSFPSGHTLSATVIAAVTLLALLPMAKTTWQRAGLWTVAIAWPLLMAASRVYLGRHYVTDVLAGLLLGVAWVAFCRAFLIGAVNLGLDRPDELLQRTPSAVAT